MNKLHTFLILLALAIPAGAQTAQSDVAAGVSVNGSTSYDPSPAPGGDFRNFVGAYIKARYALPKGLQARAQVDYLSDAPLGTIFTYDEETRRKAKSQLEFDAGLAYSPTADEKRAVSLYATAGARIFKQYFIKAKPTPRPLPALVYGEHEYGPGEPTAGLNPYIGFGAVIRDRFDVGYTHYFTDPTSFNDSHLRGHEIKVSYTRPVVYGLELEIGAAIEHDTYN